MLVALLVGTVAWSAVAGAPTPARHPHLFTGSAVLEDDRPLTVVDLADAAVTVRLQGIYAQVGAKNYADIQAVPVNGGTILVNRRDGTFNLLGDDDYLVDRTGAGIGLGRLAGATGAQGFSDGADAYIVRYGPHSTVSLVDRATVAAASDSASGHATATVAPRGFAALGAPIGDRAGSVTVSGGNLWTLVGKGRSCRLVELTPAASGQGTLVSHARAQVTGGCATAALASSEVAGSTGSAVALATPGHVELFGAGAPEEIKVPGTAQASELLPVSGSGDQLWYLARTARGWSVFGVDSSGASHRAHLLAGVDAKDDLAPPVESNGLLYTLDRTGSGQPALWTIDPASGKVATVRGEGRYPRKSARERASFARAEVLVDGPRVVYNNPDSLLAVVVFTDGSHAPVTIDKSTAVDVSPVGPGEVETKTTRARKKGATHGAAKTTSKRKQASKPIPDRPNPPAPIQLHAQALAPSHPQASEQAHPAAATESAAQALPQVPVQPLTQPKAPTATQAQATATTQPATPATTKAQTPAPTEPATEAANEAGTEASEATPAETPNTVSSAAEEANPAPTDTQGQTGSDQSQSDTGTGSGSADQNQQGNGNGNSNGNGNQNQSATPAAPTPQPVSGQVDCADTTEAPYAPQISGITPSADSALVSWSYQLRNEQDCEPDSWSVQMTALGGAAQPDDPIQTVTGQNQLQFTGLQPGTSYQVIVTAYIGRQSTASAPVTFTTPATNPGAPSSVTTTADGNGDWIVSWTPCSGSGCAPASTWTVTGTSCGSVYVGQPPSAQVPGDQYQVTIPAGNEVGASVSFSVQGSTTGGLVGPPTSDGECTEAWQAPDSSDIGLDANAVVVGSTVTATLEVTTHGSAEKAFGSDAVEFTYSVGGETVGPTTETTVTISGLPLGNTYTPTVTVVPVDHPSAAVTISGEPFSETTPWPSGMAVQAIATTASDPNTGTVTATFSGLPTGTFTAEGTIVCGSTDITFSGPVTGGQLSIENFDLDTMGGNCTLSTTLTDTATPNPYGVPSPALTTSFTIGSQPSYSFTATVDPSSPDAPVVDVAYAGGGEPPAGANWTVTPTGACANVPGVTSAAPDFPYRLDLSSCADPQGAAFVVSWEYLGATESATVPLQGTFPTPTPPTTSSATPPTTSGATPPTTSGATPPTTSDATPPTTSDATPPTTSTTATPKSTTGASTQ